MKGGHNCLPFFRFVMITLQEALNENVCYVKPVVIGQNKWYYIHAYNGDILTAVTSHALAFATAKQHDLVPMSIH